ncbi:MICOS complex subunit mic19 [Erysiphe neolycopersici]|uniref:MICOS complex subunit mic19 n=1 Tax=Erysiphe neolycopersici TaxID=212602 RepID=A0A420HSK0_9PEZI|nr:MICOS complex subunit mic19 [Erysiphe neolycopersici]
MGSQSSKSDTSNNNNVQDNSKNAVQFSQPFIDYLQNSSETDSIRAKALELEIQSRVNAELQRLQITAAKEYAELQAKISVEEEINKHDSKISSGDDEASEKVSAGDRLRRLGREAVQGDIRELKTKLEKNKRVRELDENVDKAKSEVVKCLQENDRRPLDCWAQVEKFKKEVARLEDSWIQKVIS